MKKKDRLLVIRITSEMFEKLAVVAEERDTTKSEIVREAIVQAIKKPD